MKKTLATSAAVSALAPLSQAQVFHYDIPDQDVTQPSGSYLYVDLDTGAYDRTGAIAYDLRLAFVDSSFSYEKPIFTSTSSWAAMTDPTYVSRLSFGDEIGSANTTSSYYLEYNDSGSWNNDVGGTTAYIGLMNTETNQEGWLAIDYDDAANAMTLQSFATAATGLQLTAGQTSVPEPSRAALLVALAAGSAVLSKRRRIV